MVDATAGRPSKSSWLPARRAYVELLAGADPATTEISDGAFDLRPGWETAEPLTSTAEGDLMLMSGPGDLLELRDVVERVTGPGTWPTPDLPIGFVVVETKTGSVVLERPAPALSLIMSMATLIEDRSRAWRTWKTVVESIGMALDSTSSLTLETTVVRRP